MTWFSRSQSEYRAVNNAERIMNIDINTGNGKVDRYLEELRNMWALQTRRGTWLNLEDPEGYIPIYDETVKREDYEEYRLNIHKLMMKIKEIIN